MSSRAAARIAWTIVGLSIALMALRWLFIFFFPPAPFEEVPLAFFVLWEVLSLTFPVVGAFVASRRPHNPIGWILCGMGLLNIVQSFTAAYGDYALVVQPGSLPAGEYISWISIWLGIPSTFLAATFLFLLFPDGRLPSRRWRFVGWMAVCGSLMLALGDAFHPYPFYGLPSVENPVGIGGALPQRLWEVLSAAGGTLLLASSIASVASLILRLRRARGDERQQLKWFAYAATLMIGGVITSFLFEAVAVGSWSELANQIAWMTGFVGFLLLPVFIAIAILKYRLYDIDLVINRTLVYGALSAIVVAFYVLMVGGLGTLLQAQGNLAVSLLATGLVAVLFQPMRDRLQRMVNRLMYGERDEPYAVLSRLGRHLEGTLVSEAALTTIVETIAQALKLPYAAIALEQDDGGLAIAAEYGTPVSDEPVVMPLAYQKTQVGQLILAPRAPGEALSPSDRSLLEDLARQAGVAVHAVRLTADLQRSRERLVTAREEERRRMRRDLHDGLGPQLASLTMRAEAAHDLVPIDPGRAQEMLEDLAEQAQAAVADVRRLVYALRSPELDSLGLMGALRSQIAHHDHGGLQVRIEGPEELPALPAAVEVAAYRIALEALTNVVRHAEAHNCTVRLMLDEEVSALRLEVEDDGRGIGEDPRTGVGMSSMRERAEELGGSYSIEAAPSGGTRVRAFLPFTREDAVGDEPVRPDSKET
jgi:signal transduction histidine kinase